jgi:hypothetical protein
MGSRRGLAILCNPHFRTDASSIQILHQEPNRPKFEVSSDDLPHRFCFFLIHDQATVDYVVTDRYQTAHPHPLLLGGGDLVADSFAGDLTFELGERQQYIQRQPSHRGRSVELLDDRDERYAASIEHFDHPGKVRERTGEAIDLVDHHNIYQSFIDISQEAPKRWAFHRSAGRRGVATF